MAITGKLETWGGSDNIQLTLSVEVEEFGEMGIVMNRIHSPAPLTCKPSDMGVVSGIVAPNSVVAVTLPGNVSVNIPADATGKYNFSVTEGVIAGLAKPNASVTMSTPSGNITMTANAQGQFSSSTVPNSPSVSLNNNDMIGVVAGGKNFQARFFK